MLNTRWSVSAVSPVITLPSSPNSRNFCMCDYATSPCEYYELAFVDYSTISQQQDNYINDYRKFLLQPLDITSTFQFTLIDKNGVEYNLYESGTPPDDIYNDIYDQGFNLDQPLQVGVKVIWYKVAFHLGYGDYTVRISQTDFSNTVTQTTHKFRVVPFDTKRANGTIKVEVGNVGVTMNGSNWTGLTNNGINVFTNMIRVNGRLNLLDPEIEIESIEDGTRTTKPVQTKLTDQYSIAVERLPFDLGRSLIHEGVLMNWQITDYNVFNEDIRNQEMIVESSSVTITPDYARKSYELSAKSNISKLNRKFV